MKLKVTLILLTVALSACAQLEIITPNPRVEPPETRGEAWKWKVGGSASSAHRYKATEEAGARPPNLDDPSVTGHYDFGPTGYFSLAPRFDLGLEYNILGSGLSLMGKLQVAGDGTISAKEGNIPVALFARTGTVRGDKSGDQSVTFGAGGYPWKGEINTNFVQAGISGGYRPSDWILIWGGGAFAKYWADIKITQDSNGSGTSPGGTYSKDATADGYGGSGGVMFSWTKFQVYVAGEYVTIDYNDAPMEDQQSVHAGVYFTP